MGCGRQGRLCVHPCLRGTLAIAVRVRPDRLSPNTIRACCGNLLVRFTAAPGRMGANFWMTVSLLRTGIRTLGYDTLEYGTQGYRYAKEA